MTESAHGRFDRAIILVLDSVGVGELPDAADYGDSGSDTLGHTATAVGGLTLPNLGRLGLGSLHAVQGVPPIDRSQAFFGRCLELSAGKDTTTGHWEMAGIVMREPFPTYPDGFPPEIVEAFERAVGQEMIGNKAASGTVIIDELGAEHMRTGSPIVYTSADSVFQIAAHEAIIPVEELYAMCRAARELLVGDHAVGRVIARPFEGEAGAFRRTVRRHDFSLAPIAETHLERLDAGGLPVVGIGKIADIFGGVGVTLSHPTTGNQDGMERILTVLAEVPRGLIFANLVDFDMLYGHRNDPAGYGAALVAVDQWLPSMLDRLNDRDLLLITADHGCDPTTTSTDHSREYIPLIAYSPAFTEAEASARDLGVRRGFCDIGATAAEALGVKVSDMHGDSFLPLLEGAIVSRPSR